MKLALSLGTSAPLGSYARVQRQNLAATYRLHRDTATLRLLAGQPSRRQQQQVVAASASYDAGAAAAAGQPVEAQPAPAAAVVTKKKGSSLAKRAVFGTILGLAGAVVIVSGGWLYAAVTCLVAFQASQELIGMLNAKGIAAVLMPPPPLINNVNSLLCVLFNLWVFVTSGRAASAMAVATFVVLSLQLLAVEKPRFSQLSSSVFTLLYCGYLPSFWLKLRLVTAPAANSLILQPWPHALGGPAHMTVGLVAVFITVLCIILADTGAYFFGKALGRTQLSSISPKKTVEGAAGGLLCSIAGALGCHALVAWPASPAAAAALGTIIFFSSIFGDLIESVIKREAGVKDASNLIPGHGGLLDRLDSYLFTGAVVYFYIKFLLPSYGL
ncbi:hypothetical protein N2152v2_008331 [Parachlorella kessleri]